MVKDQIDPEEENRQNIARNAAKSAQSQTSEEIIRDAFAVLWSREWYWLIRRLQPPATVKQEPA